MNDTDTTTRPDHHTHSGAGMARTDAVPSTWLELATVVDGYNGNFDQMLEAAGADFQVKKRPVRTDDPNNPGQLIPTGGYYTYKDDFDVDRPRFGSLGGRIEDAVRPSGITVLGKNVGKDYKIIQNRQSIELAAEIAGLVEGGTLIACGVLDAGVRFFGVIELPDQTFDTAKHPDRIGSQLIVHTGHDGGTSCSLRLSRTRFFCTNQLAGMLSRSQVSIRHSGDIDLSLEEAKAQLGFVLTADEEFALTAKRLMGEGMQGMSLVRRIADRIWPTAPNPTDQQAQTRRDRLQRLDQLLDTETDQVGIEQVRRAPGADELQSVVHPHPSRSERSSHLGCVQQPHPGDHAAGHEPRSDRRLRSLTMTDIYYPRTTISQEIAGLRAATGMRNPMTRHDYRRPLRAKMLSDARLHLLTLADAPAHVHGLASSPISTWNQQRGVDVRSLIRERLTQRSSHRATDTTSQAGA